MTLSFIIIGNQEDVKGNPVPYHRSTQGSKWNPPHQRYLAWKDHVRASYLKEARSSKTIMGFPMSNEGHPIGGDPHGFVTATIYFGAETHADPDNIIKGILDSIFKQDKHIDVQTFHECRSPDPRVVVEINLYSHTHE